MYASEESLVVSGLGQSHLKKALPLRVGQLFHIDSVSSTAGTSDETGTGFGLMLSKEFIELNNGEINVVSEKGKGTVFSVLIPLDK